MALKALLAAIILIVVALLLWLYIQITTPFEFRRIEQPRKPSAAAVIMGDLLNAANYELRSLELGRWFLDQLRAQLREGTSCGDVDHEAIVARLPNTNDVTRAEQAKHLRALLALACAGPKSPMAMLDGFGALLATGPKVGVYAYAPRSSVPLP